MKIPHAALLTACCLLLSLRPALGAEMVAKANYGVVFKVLGTKGTWVNVEHAQGVSGWVEGSLLWGR